MRVLHVHSGNLFGGVETLLLTLARRSGESGLHSEFSLCFPGRLSEELRALGVAPQQLGAVRARSPLSIWRARRELSSRLRSERFDVAFCHSPWALALFGSTARGAGFPVAFYLHGQARCEDALEWWASRNAPDLVLCNSNFTQATLPRLFPGVSSERVNYPVEDRRALLTEEERATLRRDLRTPVDATVIVQVSRMEEWKGHHLHLEALALLRDEPSWICWQVGGAQRPSEVAYLERLKRRAGELGIADRIRFLHERSDVPSLLAAADIHCQPNTGPEPFGITFVEALYSGRPVVTTAIGAAPEIITDQCGMLVAPDSPEALSGALRLLITDGELRATLAAGGPSRARELCDPATQMQRIREALERLSDPQRTAPARRVG